MLEISFPDEQGPSDCSSGPLHVPWGLVGHTNMHKRHTNGIMYLKSQKLTLVV